MCNGKIKKLRLRNKCEYRHVEEAHDGQGWSIYGKKMAGERAIGPTGEEAKELKVLTSGTEGRRGGVQSIDRLGGDKVIVRGGLKRAR